MWLDALGNFLDRVSQDRLSVHRLDDHANVADVVVLGGIVLVDRRLLGPGVASLRGVTAAARREQCRREKTAMTPQ